MEDIEHVWCLPRGMREITQTHSLPATTTKRDLLECLTLANTPNSLLVERNRICEQYRPNKIYIISYIYIFLLQ